MIIQEPETIELFVKKGDTCRLLFVWEDTVSGEPYDFTDCTLKQDIQNRRTNEVIIALTGDPGGGLSLGDDPGTIVLEIDAEVMALVPEGTYKTDQQITWQDGVVESSPTFFITVIDDITSSV